MNQKGKARSAGKKGRRPTGRATAAVPIAPGGDGFPWMSAAVLAVAVAVFPVFSAEALTSAGSAVLMPLAVYGVAWLLAAVLTRPSVFGGDRGFVGLTFLLLGLGITVQMRFGTWVPSWTAWRAYAPLLTGLTLFLFCLRGVSVTLLAVLLRRFRWGFWLAAMATLGVLFAFGRVYRGGLFLPGQINPTEAVKLFLVCFAAGWLPLRREGLSRTVLGIPLPPLGTALALLFAWGAPLAGAVAVRDLGLALILCLTLVFMLSVQTGRSGWFWVGTALAAMAGYLIRFVSAHTYERFDVWLHPFVDPLDSGWQIGQSLTAEYAGGLWGTGLGAGAPASVPIVSSDFVYAAMAEELGLIGCGLILLLYWCWLSRAIAVSCDAEDSSLRLLGSGFAAVIGAQILLNVGGVTKALPMTGITLPFFSQGGFSLMVVLVFCGLVAVLSGTRRRGA